MEKWEEILKKNLVDSKASLPEDDFALFQEKLSKSKTKKAAVIVPFAKIAKFAAPALAACAAVAMVVLHPFGVKDGLKDNQELIQPVQNESVLADLQGDEMTSSEIAVVEEPTSGSSSSASSVPAKINRNPQREAEVKPHDKDDSIADAIIPSKDTDSNVVESSEKKMDSSNEDNADFLKQQAVNEIIKGSTSVYQGLGGNDPIVRDRKGGKVVLAAAGVSGGTALGVLASAVAAAGGIFPKSYDAFEPVFDAGYSYFNPVASENFNEVAGIYRHIIPLKAGLTARIPVANKLYVMSGLEYSIYYSKIDYPNHTQRKQFAHYVGVPVRLDWAFASARKVDFYIGAGGELDFCVAAKMGDKKIDKDKPIFSAMGAAGVQYNFSKLLGVYIEPQVLWSPGSEDNNLSTYRSKHPVYLSGAVGLRFNL